MTLIPELPKHAFLVRLIGAISGIAVVVGGIGAALAQYLGHPTVERFAGYIVVVGMFGLLGASLLIRHARCPTCGSWMRQRDNNEPEGLSGRFECSKCHAVWSTDERTRVDIDIGT